MKSSPDDKKSHPIVASQDRCVWMTAGILSYQLCERAFDCDNCPLESAMRMHFGRRDPHSIVDPSTHAEKQNYLYSHNHCWIARKTPAIVRVGIEPTFASLLSPKEIVLPFVGDILTRDQYSCWIILEGGTLHISSPVSGRVSAINSSITTDPFIVCSSSLINGWLYEVRMQSDLSAESMLMKKEEADGVYISDSKRFKSLVQKAMVHHEQNVGATLPDGGQLLHDVAAMLGARKYFELVNDIYGGELKSP